MSAAQIRQVKNLEELQLVEAVWHDATSNHGWYTLEQIEKDATLLQECKTVGYLVRRDRRQIVLAQGQCENGKLSELWCIPTPWLTRVTVIRPGEKRRS